MKNIYKNHPFTVSVREWMRANKILQADLADLVGVPRGTMSHYLTGRHPWPPELVAALLTLGCPLRPEEKPEATPPSHANPDTRECLQKAAYWLFLAAGGRTEDFEQLRKTNQ